MSRGPALERRHLAQGSKRRGQRHHDAPSDQPDPRPVREVVGEELGGEAVACVSGSRPRGDEETGRPGEAREPIRNQRERGEGRDRRDQPHASRMVRVAGGCGPRKERDPGRHGGHAQDLPPADPLPQHARPDHEQDDQARRQHGLDHRERDQQERADLSRPATQSEARADQPARLREEAADQGDAEVLLLGRLPGLERLQPDRRRVEDRGREREREAGENVHGQGAR